MCPRYEREKAVQTTCAIPVIIGYLLETFYHINPQHMQQNSVLNKRKSHKNITHNLGTTRLKHTKKVHLIRRERIMNFQELELKYHEKCVSIVLVNTIRYFRPTLELTMTHGLINGTQITHNSFKDARSDTID